MNRQANGPPDKKQRTGAADSQLSRNATVQAVAHRTCQCAVTICLASDELPKQQCFMALLSDPPTTRVANLHKLQRRSCRSTASCTAVHFVAAVYAALRELERVAGDEVVKLCLLSVAGDTLLAFRMGANSARLMFGDMEAAFQMVEESGRPVWKLSSISRSTGLFAACFDLKVKISKSRNGQGRESSSIPTSLVSAKDDPKTHGTQSPDFQHFEASLMKTLAEQPELTGAIQTDSRATRRHAYHLVNFLLSVRWDGTPPGY